MVEELLPVSWLCRWRDEMNAELRTLTSTFEARFGYPPGVNEVRPVDDAGLVAARDLAALPQTADDLTVLYGAVGEVVLADVGNAYFVHPARVVLDVFRSEGAVSLAAGEHPHGLVFASDGGGILFAVDRGGAVHRSKAASRDSGFDRVTESVPNFLDLIRRSVVRFVATGQPGLL